MPARTSARRTYIGVSGRGAAAQALLKLDALSPTALEACATWLNSTALASQTKANTKRRYWGAQ
jgi:hypothetical protein